jgi:hypothetical protein
MDTNRENNTTRNTIDINDNKLKYPNFFIVGAPKCGTTSLHYWLSQHPEIFMSNPKEPHYFCTDLHEEADKFNGDRNNLFKYRNKKDYLNLFKEAKNEKIIGEVSTLYLYSKKAPEKIKNKINNPKILILLRNPVEFMQSWHSQLLGNIENLKDFNKALNAENERKKGNKLKHLKSGAPSFLYYRELSEFSKYINYYYSIFNKNNIKIILLDDIRDKPEKTYKEILRFLEIDNIYFTPQFKVVNPNLKPRLFFLNTLLKNSKSIILKKIYQKIISKSTRKKIYSFLDKKNKKIRSRSKINRELKLKLKQEFKPEVKKLNKTINRDLIKLWKY